MNNNLITTININHSKQKKYIFCRNISCDNNISYVYYTIEIISKFTKGVYMKNRFFAITFLLISQYTFSTILEFPKINILRQVPNNHSRRISSYPYVSGDTFRASCNFIVDKTNRLLDPDEVKDGDTIFVVNRKPFLDFFFKNVHPQINTNYILVTHNHDKSDFESYVKYLDDDKIVAWFGVNLTINHQKAFPIPIGLANKYWKHGNTNIIEQAIRNLPEQKNILLYMNIVVNTNKDIRQPVYDTFANKNFCHKANGRTFKDYINDLARSKFVISPPGNGIDCHRTWEALFLDAIPIIASTKLDRLFEDLPVIIIDNWTKITEKFLQNKYEEIMSKKYNLEKIFADYWFKKIDKFKLKAKNKNLSSDYFTLGFNESMSRNKNFNRKFADNNPNWQKLKNLFDEHILNNPDYSEIPKIPKRIHQIWLGNNGKLPAKYDRFQKTWIDMHPDWEYKLWTENEIDEFGLKNRKQYDETNNYGVKSDIARYEILYRYGGLYVDTDFECLKPFDILHHICDFYTGSAYGKNTSFLNGLMAAAPKHPILLECVNNIKNKKSSKENYHTITNRTGPNYLTQCFFKTIELLSGPSVVFPVTYFYPWPHYFKDQNSHSEVRKWINPESFAIHHWFVSWLKTKK